MSKKANLFLLIQSLSKSERRYFKIFCFGQKVSKNYLRLFEVINQQDSYDENAIRQLFAGETFLKQLHVTKNYLYQLILKSLRNFHHKSSPLAEVRACLHHIELLFDRELYDHCHYEILKAEKFAQKYELQSTLIEIAGWKRKFHLARQSRDPILLNQYNKEEAVAIEKLQQINRYWHYSTNIFDYMNDTEGKLLQDELFTAPHPPTHLQGHILHHHVLYIYYVINGQPQKALEQINRQIENLEQHPDQIAQSPSIYISALNNQISFLIRNHRFEESIVQLEKIRTIAQQHKGTSKKLTVRTLLRAYNMELEVYRDTQDLNRGLVLKEEVQAFLEQHAASIPKEYYLLFWYQFAHLCYLDNRLHASLHWTNAIMNTRFPAARHDLDRYARLLNLLVHLELGNNMVLRYSVDNCRRFLKKQNKMQPFEQALLRFFSKASRTAKADLPALKQKLKEDLFGGTAPLVDKNVLDYFDFQTWVTQ